MRSFVILVSLFVLGGALTSSALAAATPAPSVTPQATPLPKKLSQVVVTAQRHPTPIDGSSRQTWIISGAELERLGAMTAADALRYVPGAVVQQYGVYGSLATVALRGASSAETLILINGQPANESDTGDFDFSTIPASAIDHIEVVQGGSSTLYGSAAMGGVINIFTKQPATGGNVDLYTQWGYQGEFTRGLGVTFGSPNLLARLDAQTVSGQNIFDYPAYGQLYPPGVRTNDDTKTEDTTLNLNSHLGMVHASAFLQNDASDIGAPGSVFFPSGLARQQRIYQRANLNFELPMPRTDVRLQIATDGRRLHFYDPTPPFGYDTQGNANSRELALLATQEVGSANVLTGGYDGSDDTALFDFAYQGEPYLGPPGTCQGIVESKPCVAHDASSAFYLQDEEHAPNSPLTLDAGVREEHAAGNKPVGVPSTGVSYQLVPGFDVVANYGRAFRYPDLDERYYPGYGNPALLPEYGATFDTGVRAQGVHEGLNLSYFGLDTNDLIINVPIDKFGDVKPFNVSRAHIRGVESSGEHDIGSSAHLQIAYTDFFRALDETPQYYGNRLLYRPTATASAMLWIDRGTWSYGLDSDFVGRRYADEANTQLMTPYVTTGVHVKKRISNRFAVTVAVSNLENNSNAQDELGYPVQGTTYSVRLSTR
ncbi:MAG TPA: TonB-dependent receptor [Candidatus Acidoferrales bacterium]|nr:TonB-dependent receptor [Candidatus Acidoferrales bacterium]